MKKILILGYGLTGKAVESFLKKKHYQYEILTEKEDESTIELEKIKKEDFEFVIRSPGISVFSSFYQYLQKEEIPMISEIEFAYRYLPKNVKLIGVTGSNGKTTTVELLTAVLKEKYTVYKAGNIGIPFISIIDLLKSGDIVVLELSSFQLENIQKLHLDIAVLTSLTPNHLDSVYDLEYYYKSKLNIFKNQNENDFSLTFFNNREIKKVVDRKHHYIDLSSYKPRIRKHKLLLKGKHNYENVKVVCFIASVLKVKIKKVRKVLYNFTPLEHRLENVLTYQKVLFVNDSKSTSVAATLKALKVYHKKVVLIIGGKDKHLDYTVLEKYQPYVYGEIKNKINSEKKFDTLDEVMKDVFLHLKGKKVVLFSPATSSYDQFSNYQERGNYFKKLCKENVNERE